MKIAIIGAMGRNKLIYDNQVVNSTSGVTNYAGHALLALGGEVTVFGACAPEDFKELTKDFRCDVRNIAAGTHFELFETWSKNPNEKRHEFEPAPKPILAKYIPDLEKYDFVLLGPLYNSDMPNQTLKAIIESSAKVGLVVQGMLRYNIDGQLMLKPNPDLISNIGGIDYLFMDERELRSLTDAKDREEGVEILQGYGASNIVITLGDKGSIAYVGGQKHLNRAFPAESKTLYTIGAGDTFAAAFIFAQQLFDDPQKQGEFAAMVATMKIEKEGPFDGTLEQVLNRLKPYWDK
jgi:hypothetical protein